MVPTERIETQSPRLACYFPTNTSDLSDNSLTDVIPASLGGLNKLEILLLQKNLLTGLIPDALGSLKTLLAL
ncbi:unnamed protein product [Closterium sp. Naga37s-1]|nr:unnamed protein product [Closterium sp. Naga37s-1]